VLRTVAEVVELTGEPGDVMFLHPDLFHARPQPLGRPAPDGDRRATVLTPHLVPAAMAAASRLSKCRKFDR
jgi:hypothetical protein